MVNKSLKRNKKSNNKSKFNKRSKSQRNKLRRTRKQRGGDTGRYVLPPAYFGQGSKGYTNCFQPLDGAVSQGIIHPNGLFAGPNLSPTQNGGNCGCRKRR